MGPYYILVTMIPTIIISIWTYLKMPETKNDYKAYINASKSGNLKSSIQAPILDSQNWTFIESTEISENNEEAKINPKGGNRKIWLNWDFF